MLTLKEVILKKVILPTISPLHHQNRYWADHLSGSTSTFIHSDKAISVRQLWSRKNVFLAGG